jgi:hypothetical protein
VWIIRVVLDCCKMVLVPNDYGGDGVLKVGMVNFEI